jgi:predicted dehydrogenase
MTTLSVGVIGAGDIARKVHLPVLLSVADVRIKWIYDAAPERSQSVGQAFGIPALGPCEPAQLPDCDATLLAIPVGARAAYYDVLQRRPTGVLAEKPFAVSSEEHRALAMRFEPYRLACGYMRRFYSSTRVLKNLIRTKPFGPLRRLTVSEGNRSAGSRVDRSYLDDARQSARGGILSELGCHSLDLALFITEARAYDIHACEFVFDGKVDRKISARWTLNESEHLPGSGVVMDFCVSWLDRQANSIVLEFEHCTIWTSVSPDADVYMGEQPRPSTWTRLVPAVPAARTANQAFYLQWRSFLDGFKSRTESEISARSSLLSTALIQDLYAFGRRHA